LAIGSGAVLVALAIQWSPFVQIITPFLELNINKKIIKGE